MSNINYCDVDYNNSDEIKYPYDYISSLNHNFATGIAWDKHKSPIFLIEKIESVLVDEGCSNPDYYSPPHYEPEGIESIIVRPKLKYPKRHR